MNEEEQTRYPILHFTDMDKQIIIVTTIYFFLLDIYTAPGLQVM